VDGDGAVVADAGEAGEDGGEVDAANAVERDEEQRTPRRNGSEEASSESRLNSEEGSP
jgi:hypothetical protein